MNSVCVFVHVFLGHKKSQLHYILALGVIPANLIHEEAQFINPSFLLILGHLGC